MFSNSLPAVGDTLVELVENRKSQLGMDVIMSTLWYTKLDMLWDFGTNKTGWIEIIMSLFIGRT